MVEIFSLIAAITAIVNVIGGVVEAVTPVFKSVIGVITNSKSTSKLLRLCIVYYNNAY